MLSFGTSRELIEIDIKNLMVKNVPIEDECEMDILAMQNTRATNEQDLLVIRNTQDPYTSLNEQNRNSNVVCISF